MMFKCEICGREFINITSLGVHIARIHKIRTEEYYLKYINPEKGKCAECGKNTSFINLGKGYRKYCSTKCVSNSTEVRNKFKDTNIKKFGFEYAMQNKEIKNKHKNTCVKNLGCEFPNQNDLVKNKSKETCNKNFGCDYTFQSKNFKDKSKESFIKKYGVDNPNKSEEIKIQKKETFIKKFGYDHPSKNKNIIEKIAKNNRLNFEKIQKKYPDLINCEELISGPDGEILGHCKNSKCKNSKEKGGYFEISSYQITYRNRGINSIFDGNYFYCCEECKQECPLFGRSANQLHNILNDDPEIKYTQQEYSTFKNEVLSRQLLENKDHLENFCEICHSTEDLQVHHIQPQKLEPGYALDPPNGIVLCQKCHFEIGHEKGTECSTGNLSNKLCK